VGLQSGGLAGLQGRPAEQGPGRPEGCRPGGAEIQPGLWSGGSVGLWLVWQQPAVLLVNCGVEKPSMF
jgi:hypothetical protein